MLNFQFCYHLRKFELQLIVSSAMIAAIVGDSVNYYIGHLLAPRLFSDQHIHFLRMDHLKRTEKFAPSYLIKANLPYTPAIHFSAAGNLCHLGS